MSFNFRPILILHVWAFLVLSFEVRSGDSKVGVHLVRNPHAITNKDSATFAFQVSVDGNGTLCTDCSTNCKLDDEVSLACEGGEISYTRLGEGSHSFEVCTNVSHGVACASYNWTIDRVNPTASITSAASFISAAPVTVNISFSEPCDGGGGFRCSSVNDCNLLVYGAGNVIPNTLNVIQPNLEYSVLVSVSERGRFGRLILVMDKSFCTDSAGNQFIRTENSSFFLHYDRRPVVLDLRTHVPEKLIQIQSETRTVLATNKNNNLLVYLYFSDPVLNSSAEILDSLNTSEGSLVPISGSTLGQRRFGYQLTDTPDMAIVTVSFHSDMVISRQGTTVSPVSPVTFLYDSQRPTVRLSTTCNMRTKEKSIYILIRFTKPVFDFNSSHLSISGGHLQSFLEMSRSSYSVHIQADNEIISVNIPENITMDVSGNRNRASNNLQVRHYSMPIESLVLSSITTSIFAVTALASGFLTISTTSLLSIGAYSRPSSILCSHPARNIFRIASHIQVFALSRWLPVTWPIEYYELARGLQWSIPYFNLPWEKEHKSTVIVGSNSPKYRLFHNSEAKDSMLLTGINPQVGGMDSAAKVFGLPLTPMEYRSYFESQTIIPEAEYILGLQNSHGWRDFSRSVFWLAVIGGNLLLLHVLLVVILKLKRSNKESWSLGAVIFPRFEIFLVILALPCFCEASAALIKGGTSSGMVVGVLILSLVAFLVLSLLLFLSYGITFGKLLQYKEIHQVGKTYHWYQEFIRITLGPGKRGQWTWKNRQHSVYLTMLGSLFEDLRGPPKYMLSQISRSSSTKPPGDTIIPSDDENEDAEAPFIQKLFGILRIYYTFLECVKRIALGIVAGAYSESWSSKTPIVALLCITAFQLFFMLLKKPFIKKKVQLVEIISVSCEVALFTFGYILIVSEEKDERRFGISLLFIFSIWFVAQMINEWYALYRQIKQLDPMTNSFLNGLETAAIGFVLLFCPRIKKVESRFPIDNTGDLTSSGDRNRSSASRSSGEKPWMKHIRELARSSFTNEGMKGGSVHDPSTSKTRWGEFWRTRMSGSSSASTSIDFKSKSTGLTKELEEIFASK